MGNKIATFTEQQLDDYQVKDRCSTLFVRNKSFKRFLFSNQRIAHFLHERKYYGKPINIHFEIDA